MLDPSCNWLIMQKELLGMLCKNLVYIFISFGLLNFLYFIHKIQPDSLMIFRECFGTLKKHNALVK